MRVRLASAVSSVDGRGRGVAQVQRYILRQMRVLETALAAHVPISQGSHFFQNIISFGLGYMTVDPAASGAAELAEFLARPRERNPRSCVFCFFCFFL